MKKRFDIQLHNVVSKIVEDYPTLYSFQLPDLFPYIAAENRVQESDSIVRSMFYDSYTSAAVFVIAEDADTALLVAEAKLLRQWNTFKALHYADFARIVQAAAEDYDMLYNYDKTISGTVTHNPDFADTGETAKGYHKKTDLLHGHTVTVTNGKYEEKTSIAPYDGSPIETSVNERGHKVETIDGQTVTANNQQANTGTDSTTEIEAKTQDTTNMREYGNIGVQTIPDMLMKEIELRSVSMVQAYVDCFVRENLITTWCGEGEF